jgi:hypothetical protein
MNAHVNPLSSDMALTAAMFPKTIANAFDNRLDATLIEELIGAEILKNVRGEVEPKSGETKRAIMSNAMKPRRQRMFDFIKSNGRSTSVEVAQLTGDESTNVHADLNSMVLDGRLCKEPGISKRKRRCTYFWVNPKWSAPDYKQDEFAWMDTWKPTPMEGNT